MSLEDELQRLAGDDQSMAALEKGAQLYAAFYLKLVASGVPGEHAVEITKTFIEALPKWRKPA